MLTLTKNKKLFGLIMLIFTILAFYYTTYAVVSPKTNFTDAQKSADFMQMYYQKKQKTIY